MNIENLKDGDILCNDSGELAIVAGGGAVNLNGTHTAITDFNPTFCFRYDNGISIDKSVETVESLPPVEIGSRGLFAGIVQMCLNYKGYYGPPDIKNIDYDFGIKSYQALNEFMRDNHLKGDTVTTPEVWKQLLKDT